jgi:hypothetical protein
MSCLLGITMLQRPQDRRRPWFGKLQVPQENYLRRVYTDQSIKFLKRRPNQATYLDHRFGNCIGVGSLLPRQAWRRAISSHARGGFVHFPKEGTNIMFVNQIVREPPIPSHADRPERSRQRRCDSFFSCSRALVVMRGVTIGVPSRCMRRAALERKVRETVFRVDRIASLVMVTQSRGCQMHGVWGLAA